jgi:hypothetical protein
VNHSTLTSSATVLASILSGALFATPAVAQDNPAPPPPESTPPGQAPAAAETPTPSTTDAPSTMAPAESVPEAAQGAVAPPVAPAKPEHVVLAEEPARARGQRTDVDVDETYDGNLRHHQDHWVAFIGFRVAKISSSGFDPFADSDDLAQFSAGVGRTVMTSGNFSLAGLFLYDIGGRSSEARGANTELTVHRLTLGAEARYHIFRQLFAFGRVAPGAIHSIAKIEDLSTGVKNQATRDWVFATDLSAGATVDLTGFSKYSRKRKVAAWITLEGGYGFAGETELRMTADGGGGPVRAEPLDLGPLALAGPFMRGAFVLTY